MALQKNLSTQKAFTLIELMVVIVILGVFASIVGMSVNSSLNRKNVQKYDRLIDDLKLIRLMALDEQRIYGLKFNQPTAVHEPNYKIMTIHDAAWQKMIKSLQNPQNNPVKKQSNGRFDGLSGIDISSGLSSAQEEQLKHLWQNKKNTPARALTEQMQLNIEPLSTEEANINQTTEDMLVDNPFLTKLSPQNKPQIIWYGNGEVSPVKITVFVDGKQIGDTIFIDQLGNVSTNGIQAGL